jgi:hypothetical protein
MQDRIQEQLRVDGMNNQTLGNGTTIVIPGYNQQSTNPQYGQPMNPQYGQPMNPQYGQPMNNQPAYYGGATNPPYYGQPPMGQPMYNQNQPIIIN